MSTVSQPIRTSDATSRWQPLVSLWSGPLAPSGFEWFFVITGGLAIAIPFVVWMGESALGRSDVIRWYFWVNALISSPHVYSTYLRLQRKTREKQVSAWLGLPAYIGIVVLLGIASSLGWFIEVVTAINVWQSYHYVRQVYGVGCLYGRQSRLETVDRDLRWWAYHLAFPLLIIGRWDVLYDVWGGEVHSLVPLNFSAAVMGLLWCVAAVGVGLAMFAEVRLIRRNGREYSPVGLVNFIVFIGIHVYGFLLISHYHRGFIAVTVYHSVQYMALVWALERRKSSENRQWLARVPNLAGFALFWIILFALGYGFEQKLTVAFSSYWSQASAILLIAVSAHHYTVDSFIWRRGVGV